MQRLMPNLPSLDGLAAGVDAARAGRPGCRIQPIQAVALMFVVLSTLPPARLIGQQPAAVPPKIHTFLENCDRARRAAIIDLEQTLRGLRSGQKKAKDVPARIKSIEEDLERLRANKTLIVPTLVFLPSKGEIGRLPGIGGHVKQVLGEKSMLVTCYFTDPVVVVRNTRPVLQKVTRPVTFLIRGVSTDEVHPGMDIELKDAFQVVDVKQDLATGGGLPVPVIETFDLKQVEPYRRKN
jgi:hypothetical protein